MSAERANIDLQFRSAGGRTFLRNQYVDYPYHITKLLYDDTQERTTPKLILQSLSGGIYQGEQLNHKIELGALARVDIRTQGSTIVHNSRGLGATSATSIVLGMGSSIFYVPEPQIIFNGAQYASNISVYGIERAAHAVIGDSFLSYDPVVEAADVDFRFTMMTSFLNIEGEALAVDKAIVRGISHRRVMKGYRGFASFMFHGAEFDAPFLEECCSEIEALDAVAAYSSLPADAGFNLKALAADGAVLSRILDVVRSRTVLLSNEGNKLTVTEESLSRAYVNRP